MSRFSKITKFIDQISLAESYGTWIVDKENDRTPEHPMQIPYIDFSEMVLEFESEFYKFSENHPEYRLTSYGEILEQNGLKWDAASMENADINSLNEQCALALIMGAIRAERFCNGALLGFFENGCILRWLKRLKEIDGKENVELG